MSAIQTFLEKIKTAIYGEEVRGSIHDAIEQCYKDATGNPESVAAVVEQNDQMADLLENTPYTTAIEDTDIYELPVHTIRDAVTTGTSTWSSEKIQGMLDAAQDNLDNAQEETNQKINSIFKLIEGTVNGESGVKSVTLNPSTYGIANGELDKYMVLSVAQTDQYGYWQNLTWYYDEEENVEVTPSLALSLEENKMYMYVYTGNNAGEPMNFRYRAVLIKVK